MKEYWSPKTKFSGPSIHGAEAEEDPILQAPRRQKPRFELLVRDPDSSRHPRLYVCLNSTQSMHRLRWSLHRVVRFVVAYPA